VITFAIHGGAGALPREDMTPGQADRIHAAIYAGLLAGYGILQTSGASLDAVETAVSVLEDCPLFNAGRGSAFTREGQVEMEASIMDGSNLRAGAALLLRRVRNPVKLARLVMERTPHVALAGEAAERFATDHGLRMEAPEFFHTASRWEAMVRMRETNGTALSEDIVVSADPDSPEAAGTVGAVALDRAGNLAAATSSGGTTNKLPGRIGQACIVGAGVYANNATCAVSCTGQGEAFMRGVAAHDVSALMEHRGLGLAGAVEGVVRDRLPGMGGMIALDREGNVAALFNTRGMYRGWVDANGGVHTAIYAEVRQCPAFQS